jgi:hypothetical protein
MSGRDPLAEAIRTVDLPPPAAPLPVETLIAFQRGELAPPEHAAVAEHLAQTPEDAELVLALAEFGTPAPKPSPEEGEASWRRFAARLAAELEAAPPAAAPALPAPLEFPARPHRSPWMPRALAASLLVSCLSVGWAFWERGERGQAGERMAAVAVRPNTPIVNLVAEGAGNRAGGPAGAPRLSQTLGEATLTMTPPGAELPAGPFTGRILTSSGREVWQGGLALSPEETFTLTLAPALFRPGLYKMEIHAQSAGAAVPVGTFPFEITAEGPR